MPANKCDSTDKMPTSKQVSKINALSSYIVAVAGSIFFHPIDRAFFLSIANKRAYFVKSNFSQPFQGVMQTVMYKQVTGSVYFFIQGELQQRLSPTLREAGLSESMTQLCIGALSGAADGTVKNAPTAIRAHSWQHKRTFMASTFSMWNKGGFKPFFNGAPATISRDTIAGGIYEVVRKNLREVADVKTNNSHENVTHFLSDIVAAGTATIAGAPINYARTMQYKTKPEEIPPTIIESLASLTHETLEIPTVLGKMRFFQKAVGLGVGSARVAAGLAVTQLGVDALRKSLQVAVTDPAPSLAGNIVKRIIS